MAKQPFPAAKPGYENSAADRAEDKKGAKKGAKKPKKGSKGC